MFYLSMSRSGTLSGGDMVTEDHPGQSGEAQADRDFVGTVGQHQDYAMTEETFPSGYMFFSKLQVISQIRTAL